MSVELIAEGVECAKRVAKVLPSAKPVTVSSNLGDVELRPGAVWSGDRMLVSADGAKTNYVIGDKYYRTGTSDFIREEWFAALQRAGKSAMGMVYLGQIQMAVLAGMFVPWYLMLGIGAAQVATFYVAYEEEIDLALEYAGELLVALAVIKSMYPKTYQILKDKVLVPVLKSLPENISAEDVAFMVGRVLQGNGFALIVLGSLKPLVKLILKVSALVMLVHLPSIAARAAHSAAQQLATQVKAHSGDLIKAFKSAGVHISSREADQMLGELLSSSRAVGDLTKLQNAAEKLVNALEKIPRDEL
jgi:hypothetical protein